jgi:uncharacterized protein (TIGR03067 family)
MTAEKPEKLPRTEKSRLEKPKDEKVEKASTEAKYRIVPKKTPKQIDISRRVAGEKNDADEADFDEKKENFIKGIYQIDEDRLALCFAWWEPTRLCIVGETNPRPTDFETHVADHLSVLKFERVKPNGD